MLQTLQTLSAITKPYETTRNGACGGRLSRSSTPDRIRPIEVSDRQSIAIDALISRGTPRHRPVVEIAGQSINRPAGDPMALPAAMLANIRDEGAAASISFRQSAALTLLAVSYGRASPFF